MKKLLAFLGSCLLLAGVKAQTGHSAKKETTKPTMTKPVTGSQPALFLKGQSQIKPTAVKPSTPKVKAKKKNG